MSDGLKRDYQERLGEKYGAIFNGVSYDWRTDWSGLTSTGLFSVTRPISSSSIRLVVRLCWTCSKSSGAICCFTSPG